MVGIAHYYMQLNIVYSILLQKENILIFIFFASSTLLLTLVFFFFKPSHFPWKSIFLLWCYQGSL